MLYAVPGASEPSQFPSYFFSEEIGEWVIFRFDPTTHSYLVSTQLILTRNQRPVLLTQEPEGKHKQIVNDILTIVRAGAFKRDVRPSLPLKFTSRILLIDHDTAVIVARTEDEVQQVVMAAQQLDLETQAQAQVRINNTGREQYHFQWSKQNWARFCAKTALESLCLFEGSERCLSHEFSLVRDFVLNRRLAMGKELVFNQGGPREATDVPSQVQLDLTVNQIAPESLSCVLPRCEEGSHAIFLHEIRGWILSSVVFAGLPATVLVLAGPNAHLNDFYQMIYDEQESEFHFLRLAYNEAEPVIPLAIPGGRFTELAETYRLRAI